MDITWAFTLMLPHGELTITLSPLFYSPFCGVTRAYVSYGMGHEPSKIWYLAWSEGTMEVLNKPDDR